MELIQENLPGEEVSVRENNASRIPAHSSLEQNYPNPLNPVTKIRYALSQKSRVHLTVYSLIGQHAATLIEEEKEAGYHELTFDASALPSGVHFNRLQARSFVETRKLVLVR
jgi:hypothetical protein